MLMSIISYGTNHKFWAQSLGEDTDKILCHAFIAGQTHHVCVANTDDGYGSKTKERNTAGATS